MSFNTQCSTQWDGFNHFPYKNYPKEGEYTYYAGQTTEVARDKSIKKYGIQSESGQAGRRQAGTTSCGGSWGVSGRWVW